MRAVAWLMLFFLMTSLSFCSEASKSISVATLNLKEGVFPDAILNEGDVPTNVKKHFEDRGVAFSKNQHSKVVYYRMRNELDIAVTPENQLLIEALLQEYIVYTDQQIENRKRMLKQHAIDQKRIQALYDKLNRLRIPELSFTDTSIIDAAKWLQSFAAKAGIQVELIEKANDPENTPIPTITLDVRDMPFVKVLDFFTQLSNCSYQVTPDRVILYY
jgi:hypothetical protein